jgi:D-lyxose ketol-isomerase
MSMNRRELMSSAFAGAAGITLAASKQALAADACCAGLKKYPNEHFYKSDGTFDAEAGKAAMYEMFEHYNYPIVPRLKSDEFWVADFGLGKFAEIGMGGIFWLNLKDENYFGHEIYLLPGQNIPEHRHVQTSDAEAKRESWQVRHGWVYLFGEGEESPEWKTLVPPSHKECCKSKAVAKLMPGEVEHMGGPEQWHFMQGGDAGAIVTEYATYHDGNGLRFSHPGVSM